MLGQIVKYLQDRNIPVEKYDGSSIKTNHKIATSISFPI